MCFSMLSLLRIGVPVYPIEGESLFWLPVQNWTETTVVPFWNIKNVNKYWILISL